MENIEKLEWSAFEYEDKERSTDWFWALGVIVVASAASSIIYNNYFFAVLIVLGGVLLGFFAVKKPDIVLYELNTKGLKIMNRLYPYENIKSFWVQRESQSADLELASMLFIKSERVFMPMISIPIEEYMALQIRDILLEKNIVEEEMREHASLKIMESLGF